MEGFVEESRVIEIFQRGSADRAILYFASGLSEVQACSYFNSDWCFELNISNTRVDARHFSLVDHFDAGSHVRYRALFLLECIRSQFSQGEGRSTALALLLNGTDFDCFLKINHSVQAALSNPLFHCRAEEVHRRADALKGNENDIESCSKFRKCLRMAYAHMQNVADAMEGLSDSNRWFVLKEGYPSDTSDERPIVVTFMVRHNSVDSDPEIIIAIEHTMVKVDESLVDQFACDYNCDSYVERYVTYEPSSLTFY